MRKRRLTQNKILLRIFHQYMYTFLNNIKKGSYKRNKKFYKKRSIAYNEMAKLDKYLIEKTNIDINLIYFRRYGKSFKKMIFIFNTYSLGWNLNIKSIPVHVKNKENVNAAILNVVEKFQKHFLKLQKIMSNN